MFLVSCRACFAAARLRFHCEGVLERWFSSHMYSHLFRAIKWKVKSTEELRLRGIMKVYCSIEPVCGASCKKGKTYCLWVPPMTNSTSNSYQECNFISIKLIFTFHTRSSKSLYFFYVKNFFHFWGEVFIIKLTKSMIFIIFEQFLSI